MRKLILTVVLAMLFAVNVFGGELVAVNSTLSVTGVMDEDGGHTFTYATSTGGYGIINVGEDIYIDIFSKDGVLEGSKKINNTEEKFGGYLYDGTYHYFLFGNDNPNCSSSTTVYKLVKYNQSFNKMNTLTFKGGQIYAKEVFLSNDGLCDMRVEGNYLFINDVVSEYRYENKYYKNNRSLVIDKNTFKLKAGIGGMSLSKSSTGRDEVLSSMSVFDDNKYYFAVQLKSGINLFEVDPDDTESLGEHSIKNLASSQLSSYYSDTIMTNAKNMGSIELKGFVAGESDFIVVGTEDNPDAEEGGTRIFVSRVSKNQMGVISPSTEAVSEYEDIENVKVIKLSSTDILIMWQKDGVINLRHIDGSGKATGGVKKIYGAELGTTAPYVAADNKYMVWTYMVNDDDFAFYKYTF